MFATNKLPFSVEVVGSFYTYKLYDIEGRGIYNLNEAAENAELQYGEDWNSVFNGSEAIDREDWVERCDWCECEVNSGRWESSVYLYCSEKCRDNHCNEKHSLGEDI